MATLSSAAHVSRSPFVPSTFSSLLLSSSNRKASKLCGARCALSPPKWRESRRLVSISLLFSCFFYAPNRAMASSLFDRKKLDPLESYIPAVILTQLQIKDLEKTLEVDQPRYDNCRSLLRYGPAASLRVNIRAVAQYASDAGNGKTAFSDVDECLRALEELDSLFLHASRKDPDASVGAMKAKIATAISALDSLLQTIPSDVLDKGKAIADMYRTTEDVKAEISDPEIKQLESIL
ncbi:uncharacterized protein LOC110809244 isoform X2 [Carica papaya]|uniref:uncharacterized protein LOC110809244 isoform X2 n=1 Tax=Carica papaya TaxID=3649 RepID=UPI000B8C7DB1|nr:uncharacterized protein LOC110809244 isoform X2 [Carica papaya]